MRFGCLSLFCFSFFPRNAEPNIPRSAFPSASAEETRFFSRRNLPVAIKADIVYLTSTESYCYNDWIVVIGAVFGVPVMLGDALARRKRSKRRRAEVPPPA